MSVIDIVCQAIERRHALSFRYKGSIRVAEPYILGYDDKDVLMLSAVQISGGSGFGFRTFPVDGMRLLTITDKKFFGGRPEYNPRDRFFSRIICQV